jgi:hypothetical protein
LNMVNTTCRDFEGDGDVMKETEFDSTGDSDEAEASMNINIIIIAEPVNPMTGTSWSHSHTSDVGSRPVTVRIIDLARQKVRITIYGC